MLIASNTTRQISSDLALKILNSGSETVTSGQSTAPSPKPSPSSAIAVETSKKIQANFTAAWMHNLPAPTGLPAGTQQVWTQTPRLDVTSSSFKEYLRSSAETAKAWSSYSVEIVDALNAGTLSIESPETNAFDIALYDKDGNSIGSSMTYDEEAWKDFLDEHLTRGENGNYARSASGAYIDKATGQSADLGQIGGNFFYMTWPTPK